MDMSFGGSAFNPLLRVQAEGRPGIVPLVTLVFCVMWKGYLNFPVPQQWEDTEAHRRSLRVLVGHLPVRTLDRATLSRKSQPDCRGSDQPPSSGVSTVFTKPKPALGSACCTGNGSWDGNQGS